MYEYKFQPFTFQWYIIEVLRLEPYSISQLTDLGTAERFQPSPNISRSCCCNIPFICDAGSVDPNTTVAAGWNSIWIPPVGQLIENLTMRRHCLRAIIIRLKWPFTRYFEILHHMFTYCIHVCRLTFEYTVMYIQCSDILILLLNTIERVRVHNVRNNNRALYNRICILLLYVHMALCVQHLF